jgi:hypothetical protein
MPGKSIVYPNQPSTIRLVTASGMVSARLSQNLRRNISGSCPACLSCPAWALCPA